MRQIKLKITRRSARGHSIGQLYRRDLVLRGLGQLLGALVKFIDARGRHFRSESPISFVFNRNKFVESSSFRKFPAWLEFPKTKQKCCLLFDVDVPKTRQVLRLVGAKKLARFGKKSKNIFFLKRYIF